MVAGQEHARPEEELEGSDDRASVNGGDAQLELVPDDLEATAEKSLTSGITVAGSPEAYLQAVQAQRAEAWGKYEELRKLKKQQRRPSNAFLNLPEVAALLEDIKVLDRMEARVQQRITNSALAPAEEPTEAPSALAENQDVAETPTEESIADRSPVNGVFQSEVRRQGGTDESRAVYQKRIAFLESKRTPSDTPEQKRQIDASIAFLQKKIERLALNKPVLMKRNVAAPDQRADLLGRDYDPTTGLWTEYQPDGTRREQSTSETAPARESDFQPETTAASTTPAPVDEAQSHARQEVYASFDDEVIAMAAPDRLREKLGRKNLDRVIEYVASERHDPNSPAHQRLIKEIADEIGLRPETVFETVEAAYRQLDEATQEHLAAEQHGLSRLQRVLRGSAKTAGNAGLLFAVGATASSVLASPLATVGIVQGVRIGQMGFDKLRDRYRFLKTRRQLAEQILKGQMVPNTTLNAREAFEERWLEAASFAKRAEVRQRVFHIDEIRREATQEAALAQQLAKTKKPAEREQLAAKLESLQAQRALRQERSVVDVSQRAYQRLVEQLGISPAEAESMVALAAQHYRLDQERVVEEETLAALHTKSFSETVEGVLSAWRREPGQKARSGFVSLALGAAAVLKEMPYVRTAYGAVAGADIAAGVAQATERRQYAGSLSRAEKEVAETLKAPSGEIDATHATRVLAEARFALREAERLRQSEFLRARLERQVDALEDKLVALRLSPEQAFSRTYLEVGKQRQRLAEQERTRNSRRSLLARVAGATIGGVIAEFGIRLRDISGSGHHSSTGESSLNDQAASENTAEFTGHKSSDDVGVIDRSPRHGVEATEIEPIGREGMEVLPETNQIQEASLIQKGEGIEHALRRQLEARGLSHAEAGNEAHRIALSENLVRPDGTETRVLWDPNNRVRAVLMPDNHVRIVDASLGEDPSLYPWNKETGNGVPFSASETHSVGVNAADTQTAAKVVGRPELRPDTGWQQTPPSLVNEPFESATAVRESTNVPTQPASTRAEAITPDFQPWEPGQTDRVHEAVTDNRIASVDATVSEGVTRADAAPTDVSRETAVSVAEPITEVAAAEAFEATPEHVRGLTDQELLDSLRESTTNPQKLNHNLDEGLKDLVGQISKVELQADKPLSGPGEIFDQARLVAAYKRVVDEQLYKQDFGAQRNTLDVGGLFVGRVRAVLERHIEAATDFADTMKKEYGAESEQATAAVAHVSQWQEFQRLMTKKPAPTFTELLKQRESW